MELNLSTKKTNRTRRHNRNMNLFMVISAGMLIQGCTVGPNYIVPDIEAPDIWHEQAVQGLSTGQANLQTWWTHFDDPVLTELINRAGQNNLDLKIASSRIMEARAFRGFERGEYYPDVDGKGVYNRYRNSNKE